MRRGQKSTGRNRHIVVDTHGLLLNVVVPRANLQDRDGIRHLQRDAKHRFPSIIKLFADASYQVHSSPKPTALAREVD